MNMTDNNFEIREQLSALADGQLRDDAVAGLLERVGTDRELWADWNVYHVVGEVLRSGEQAGGGASPAFVDRLRARLADQQIAPPAGIDALPPQPAAEMHERLRRSAANEPNFRWKLAAGFASIAAVAAIGWNLVALPAPGAQLAAAPATAVGATTVAREAQAPVMIRDARLDELLAAHKQAGGASALQMPSGFLRNATFEGNER